MAHNAWVKGKPAARCCASYCRSLGVFPVPPAFAYQYGGSRSCWWPTGSARQRAALPPTLLLDNTPEGGANPHSYKGFVSRENLSPLPFAGDSLLFGGFKWRGGLSFSVACRSWCRWVECVARSGVWSVRHKPHSRSSGVEGSGRWTLGEGKRGRRFDRLFEIVRRLMMITTGAPLLAGQPRSSARCSCPYQTLPVSSFLGPTDGAWALRGGVFLCFTATVAVVASRCTSDVVRRLFQPLTREACSDDRAAD